jgi:predicted ribosome quality control (RQC) complex YloA/Tae2 family protein
VVTVPLPVEETKNEALRFRHFFIDGWDIFVGKNDKQNDELTCSFSKPWDTWLHVSSHAGSHVVIHSEDKNSSPPKNVLEKAASLAAWFSKARNAPFVKVHFTEARNVYKAHKAPAGEVQIRKYSVIKVKPAAP